MANLLPQAAFNHDNERAGLIGDVQMDLTGLHLSMQASAECIL